MKACKIAIIAVYAIFKIKYDVCDCSNLLKKNYKLNITNPILKIYAYIFRGPVNKCKFYVHFLGEKSFEDDCNDI